MWSSWQKPSKSARPRRGGSSSTRRPRCSPITASTPSRSTPWPRRPDGPRGRVYAHFGSKQGLLLALLDEWAHSLVTVIAAEFELATERRGPAAGRGRQRGHRAHRPDPPPAAPRARTVAARRARPRGGGRHAARAAEAHDRLARGFAAWIADGLIDPDRSARHPGHRRSGPSSSGSRHSTASTPTPSTPTPSWPPWPRFSGSRRATPPRPVTQRPHRIRPNN